MNIKLLKNKKSQGIFDVARKSIFWVIVAFVLAVMFIVFFFITAKYNLVPFEKSQEIQKIIYIERFENSCFAYQDDIGRVYSETIDWDKFTQQNMDSCYPASKENFAFELTLKIGNDEKMVRSKNFVSARSQLTKSIFVFKDNKKQEGELIISYLQP
ncbi:MAG TPA: hypothetical protein VI894_02505 [Candidatus Nanoarchaeia archaeon]|nr:hypothetical protein [Candidatus Nanoarchaeia archaeon]